MTMYLATWPDGKVTLVSASNLLDLFERLESTGDVTKCSIQEYKEGDICLTFQPNETIYEVKKPKSFKAINYPDCTSSLSEAFKKMINDPTYSDVTLIIEDKELKCHKAILAGRCKYFKTMFESNLKEKSANEVHLQGFSFEIVQCIVEFLYTGVCSKPEQDHNGCMCECRGNTSMETDDDTANKKPLNSRSCSRQEEYLKLFHYLIHIKTLLLAADFFDIPDLSKVCQHEISETMYSIHEFAVINMNFDCDDQLEFSLCESACTAYLEICYGLFQVAEQMHLEELQYNIASCCVKFSDYIVCEHAPDVMLTYISESHLMNRNSPLYFGIDGKLYNFLSKGDLSAHDALDTVKDMAKEGADFAKIFSAHELMMRACVNHFCMPEMEESIWQIVEYIIENGYDINSLDYHGKTLLHLAAVNKKEDFVQRLLAKGANPHIKDSGGLNVMQDVRHEFDGELAYFIYQDLLKLDQHDMSNIRQVIDEHQDFWAEYRVIINLLQASVKSMNLTNQTPAPELCLGDFSLKFDEDFIQRTAELFCHQYPNNSENGENSDNVLIPIRDKSLLTLQLSPQSGYFSTEFVSEMMAALYPSFKNILNNVHVNLSQEEIKKKLRQALSQDVLSGRQQKGPGMRLCSIKTLNEFGYFSNWPQYSWIHSVRRILIAA